MSDTQQGPGWWIASDGKWYPPESATVPTPTPAVQPPVTPAPVAQPAAMPAPNVQPPMPTMQPPVAAPQMMGGQVAGSETGMPILPPGVDVVSPWGRLGSYLLNSVLVNVTLVIGWVVWALVLKGGQTPGKKILNQRVIDADTLQPVSLGKMFWSRGLLAGLVSAVAIVFTVGIILFMPFWDKRGQNIWDKISNTFVVNDPTNAWNIN